MGVFKNAGDVLMPNGNGEGKAVIATSIFNRSVCMALLLGLALFFAVVLPAYSSGSIKPRTSEEIADAWTNSRPIEPNEAVPDTTDLDGREARNLAEELFGPMLMSPTGIFDELKVKRFLSDTVAVLEPGQDLEVPGESDTGDPLSSPYLVESSIPLRTEDSSGVASPVDLSLGSVVGAKMQPENPLTPLDIPLELAEGIELPQAGVTVKVRGDESESAQLLEGRIGAMFANVAEDSDIVAAPTPSGFEAFTVLRSTDAPLSQVFELELPDGSHLEATSDGGAIVVREGEQILHISPAVAVDAAGEDVPVSTEIAGNTLRLTAMPSADSQFPILIDPTFSEYHSWPGGNTAPWWSKVSSGIHSFFPGAPSCSAGGCTLSVSANAGVYGPQTSSVWGINLPRYQADMTSTGKPPTSWIKSVSVSLVNFIGNGDWKTYPAAFFAVSTVNDAWISGASSLYAPNQYGPWGVDLGTVKTGTQFGFGQVAVESSLINKIRYLHMGPTQIVFGDETAPGGSASSAGWIQGSAKLGSEVPLQLQLEDTGLGMKSVAIVANNRMPAGVPSTWKAQLACVGGVADPCPRKWSTGASGIPSVPYAASEMPEGVNELTLQAKDVLGTASSTKLNVKVDRSVPSLSAISGTITEQGALGVTRPRYSVGVSASDGTEQAPQSGIAKVDVKVDGSLVESVPATGCGQDNCKSSPLVWVKTESLAPGQHQVEVVATDRVGNQSVPVTKTFSVQKDQTAPVISLEGAFKTYSGGWLNRASSYSSMASAADEGAGVQDIKMGIDGVVIATKTGSCPSGGCALSLLKTIAPGSVAIGPHVAEFQATDFAGNQSPKTNVLFSVTASGDIGTQAAEAIANSLSSETTSGGSSLIGYIPYEPTLGALEPELEDEGAPNALEIEGAGVSGRLPMSDPGDGTVVEPAGALPFALVPVGSAGAGLVASPSSSGDAVVYANVRPGTDLVTRPLRNGVGNFLTIRSTEAAIPFTWKVEGVEPIVLVKREDGGVNIVVDPAIEVPTVDTEEGGLTGDPQVVASLPAPVISDGKGKAVPGSWSIEGDLLKLQFDSAPLASDLPLQAAVLTHVQGGLQGWVPSVGDPSRPTDELLSVYGATEDKEPFASASEAEPAEEGMALSTFLPEVESNPATVQMNPAPGTEVGPTIIAQPVGEYAPAPGPNYMAGIPGVHFGTVVCSTGAPERPYSENGYIQTYGVISCAQIGERPPPYNGAKLGVCLMFRTKLADQAVFSYSKCSNQTYSGVPKASLAVTKFCNEGVVFKGKVDGGPIFHGIAVLDTQWSPASTRC